MRQPLNERAGAIADTDNTDANTASVLKTGMHRSVLSTAAALERKYVANVAVLVSFQRETSLRRAAIN
jgi:hypothetical protein